MTTLSKYFGLLAKRMDIVARELEYILPHDVITQLLEKMRYLESVKS